MSQGVVEDTRAPWRMSAGVLLDLVRSGRASTRGELRELTGLSRTAVTARVTSLMSAGLLLPGDELASTGGRPPETLALNGAAGVVLAVAVGRSRSQVGAFDLLGTELSSDSVDHEAGAGPEAVLPGVVARAREQAASAAAPLLAIGMSLPGTVDEVRAMSIDSPVIPGWDGVDLRSWFAGLGAPLSVDNDANVLAHSELLGRQRAWQDVLVVKASTGFGLGIVTGGRIVRGHLGGAGEIGHVKVDAATGLRCRCGATGCLEAVAGGWALVARMEGHPASTGGPVVHVRDLVASALRGDREARALVRESGRHLGAVLATATDLLNPEAIVLGGDMAATFDLLAGGVRESLYARSTALATRDLQIVPAVFGDRAGLVGCAALALDAVLSPGAVDARLAGGV